MICIASRRGVLLPATVCILVATLFAGGRLVASDAGAKIHAGQSLIEAIDFLRADGLQVIYSSSLVRPEMRVEDEPLSDTPAGQLREMLAPHGLIARSGPGGSLLVVPAKPTGTLRGTVRREDGAKLRARIAIDDGATAVTTDRRGRFEIELPAGKRTLTVEAPGSLPRRVENLLVEADAVAEIVVELAPEPTIQESIVVRPQWPDVGEVVTAERLQDTPGPAHDAMRAVAHLPGSAESDLSARINVRGGRDDELLLLLDGLEIHEPFHLRDFGGGMFSFIDTDDVGKIDFYRGGFPVKYGNRMSGVMDITSATATGASRTSIGVETGQGRLSTRGVFGKNHRGTWLVSARAGSPEHALPEWVSEEDYAPRYYDLFTKVEFQPGERWVVSGNVLFGLDKTNASATGDDVTQLATRYGSRYSWINLRLAWNPRLTVQTVVGQGEVDRDRDLRLADATAIDDDRDYEFVSVTQDWSYETEGHRLRWGAGFRRVRSDYDYITSGGPGGSGSVIARPSGHEYLAYLSDAIRLPGSLELELGLRLDEQTYSEFDDTALEPRAHLSWRFAPRTVARLGWGRFHQAHRVYELQVEDGVDEFSHAESAEHTVIGIEHRFANGWWLDLGAYRKRVTDLRPRYENLFDPTGFAPEAQADRVIVEPASAELDGAELTVRGTAGERIDWTVGYALSSAEDRIDGENVPRTWDQPQAADVTVSWHLEERWRFTLAGSYHSGWPTTELTAELVDGEIVATPGPRNRERLSSHHRVDVRGERGMYFGRHSLLLYVDVANLLDRDNSCCVEGFDFVQEPGGVDVRRREKSSLSRTVTTGAIWRF